MLDKFFQEFNIRISVKESLLQVTNEQEKKHFDNPEQQVIIKSSVNYNRRSYFSLE